MHKIDSILKINMKWNQMYKNENYDLHTFMGDLDKDFLQHVGGVENNSFINILHADDDDNGDQPQLISYSPYYDSDLNSHTR